MPDTTRRIYLDFNASTPVAPEVRAAMMEVLEEAYGNPSSGHWAGKLARDAVDKARLQVAGLLGCKGDEIVLTSGGSEANNHVLKGLFFAAGRRDVHIITTQIEHPAVINPCRFLERLGAKVTYLPVDGYGSVDPDECPPGTTIQHHPDFCDARQQRGWDHSADYRDCSNRAGKRNPTAYRRRPIRRKNPFPGFEISVSICCQ